MNSTKKTRATHTTPKRAARLEAPKANPSSQPQTESPKEVGIDVDRVLVEVDRINAEVSARMKRQRAKNEAKIAWVKSPKIVEERVIRNLVERFLPRDDDDAAKAFITLIQLIAQNDDGRDRDSIAVWACDTAYQMGMAYSDAALKYFDEATTEFRSRVA